jgi:iron complex transport system substrate-binding protein
VTGVQTCALPISITLEVPAQRIVSLAASNTEILFAVGAGTQVVGRDEFSDYPAEAKALPSVGGSFGKYTPEAIVNLKPDLVLAAEINTPELVQSLQDLGLKVYLLPNPTTIDGVYQNLTTVAQLTGHEKETKKLVESLQKRVKSVLDKVAKVTVKPLVFYELDSTDPNAPYTAGPGTFVDLLIQMAGGRNLGSSLQGQWAQISAEQLIVKNPDLIILGDSAYGVAAEAVGKRPGWEALQAVKKGSIYPFDDNLISRPGPRLVDGLEAMAKLLHPELYK